MTESISLSSYNTFGIDVNSNHYIQVNDVPTLQSLVAKYKTPFILGGGSNMLLTKDIQDPLFHIQIMGREVVRKINDETVVRIGAGEGWHDIVLWTIDQGLGGIENLSLIPGKIGAAPIQNIGAYGVELKDVFESLEAVHIESGELRTLNAGDCHFGYRSSIFKHAAKGKYIITSVSLRLTNSNHKHSLDYGAIQDKLSEQEITEPTIKNISDVVIAIRQSKLPDPSKLGNAGSFFKNPMISADKLATLQNKFENLRFFPFGDAFKVPAAWLIEHCGWKGKRQGQCGVSENHALVLVNYGGATGSDIQALASEIQSSVLEKFNIELQPEVNII